MTRKLLLIAVIAAVAMLVSQSRPPVTVDATAERQIYDETADARADLAAAKKEAAKTGKHVLIMWGANWCGWCHRLNDHYTTNEDISKVIEDNYIVVRVDLGHRDKNMEFARKEYGLDFNELKIPHTSIRDAGWNSLAEQQSRNFGDPNDDIDDYLPAKILPFLNEHKPEREKASAPANIYDESADAAELLAAAKQQAADSGKHVLITWGANWCGWCHKLERHFTENAEIRELIDDNFIKVHVDLGQRDKHMQLARDEYGLDFNDLYIAHVTILDAHGKSVAERQPGKLIDKSVNDRDFSAVLIRELLEQYKAAK